MGPVVESAVVVNAAVGANVVVVVVAAEDVVNAAVELAYVKPAVVVVA